RARIAKGERARARLHEQRVRVAVIAALELDDPRPAGEAACEAKCSHRRLRPGGTQPAHLRPRGHPPDQRGQLDPPLGRRPDREPRERGPETGRQDGRVRVPEDERPPRADVVDVALAVGVPEAGALAAGEETWRAPDGAECTHRGVHPAWDPTLGLVEQPVVAAHGVTLLSKSSWNARARAAISSAAKSPRITAHT